MIFFFGWKLKRKYLQGVEDIKKRVFYVILAVVLTVAVFLLPIINQSREEKTDKPENVRRVSSIFDRNNNKNNNNNNTNSPSHVVIPKSDTRVNFIVVVKGDSLGQTVMKNKDKYKNVYELIRSDDCRKYTDSIKKTQAIVKATIDKMIDSADISNSYTYNTVLNGFTVSAPVSTLEKIRKISNVVSVSPVFSSAMTISEAEISETDQESTYDISYPDDEASEDEVEESSLDEEDEENEEGQDDDKSENDDDPGIPSYQKMIGLETVHKAGFSGGGRVIAMIDNSFDPGDALFRQSPSVRRFTQDDIKAVSSKTLNDVGRQKAAWYNDKVVFSYDYGDGDTDTISSHSSHGTECAAAAAGYTSDEEGFKGTAYDSQLMFMKVCRDDSDNAYDDAMLAALDDAAKFSPDVLNISMGVYGTATNSAIFDMAYEILAETGTMIVSAAGNAAENVINRNKNGIASDYTDYGTLTYPSYSENVFAVASCDTNNSVYDYIETDGGEQIPFSYVISDSSESSSFDYTMDGIGYVFLDGYGTKDDFTETDVKDNIVILRRGEISVQEKISRAFVSGAAGVFIISDDPLYFHLSAEDVMIPSAVISSDSIVYFKNNPFGTLTFRQDGLFEVTSGGKPSLFSSYGVTSDLRLKPDISSPGTDIVLPVDGSERKITGSSVSSAIVSGAAAVMSQYLDSSGIDTDYEGKNDIIKILLMNTAVPSKFSEELYYTPKSQGSGVMNIDKAVSADMYVTAGEGKASVSMGDSEEGAFEFELTVHNLSEDERKMDLSAVLQSSKLISDDQMIYNTLEPESITANSEIVFLHDDEEIRSITVSPLGEEIIKCKIALSPELLLYYNKYAENGMHIDGYVSFKPEKDGIEITVPFSGYCGDWENAEIFDVSDYQSVKQPAVGKNSLYACIVDNNGYTSAELGKNIFTGGTDSDKISIGLNTIKNIYDINSTAVPFIIPNYYLLRNAADFTLIIKDGSGKILFSRNLGTVSSFAGADKPFAGLISTFNTDDLSNYFAGLKEGEYIFEVKASTIPYKDKKGIVKNVSYRFNVDNTAPSSPETEIYSENGHTYLKLKARDKNGVSGFVIYTASRTKNTLNYSDRISVLQENGYIRSDALKLVYSCFEEESTEFVYDISNLYRSLKGLKEYAKDNDISVPDPENIFVMTADNAFNLSAPVRCETFVPSVVTYNFTDNKGRPVEGIEMTAAGKTLTSDKQGVIEFKSLVPDIYSAVITHIPDDYSIDNYYYLVDISVDDYITAENITLSYTGAELSEESTEIQSAETSESEIIESQPDSQTDYDNDSGFALAFISIMLVITSLSLILSKRK